MTSGKLLIFSAPSGAGKTSIVRALLERVPLLSFSVSATSRPKREAEIHGRDYYFLSVEAFREKIRNNEFLEWEEVYPGSYYGTLKSELGRIWETGHHVVFDVDVVGGLNIKKQYPQQALSVFIMPPSLAELETRLRARNTETAESLESRLGKAAREMEQAPFFDAIIINDSLSEAIDKAETLVKDFLINQ